ncbi:MAG: hypothetical protein WAS05_04095 [Candidatus Nanopelagicales bacterium]
MADQFLADDDGVYAARVRKGVGVVGGAFFLTRDLRKAGGQVGLPPWPAYFLGRCGVLGQANPDVVASIVGFFPLDFVEDCWLQVQQVDLDQGMEVCLSALDEWSNNTLGGFEGVERLGELAGKAAREASPVGAPLFAGWRGMPERPTPEANAVQSLLALRELRGAMHLSAILAADITPREAIILGGGGASNASFFGWEDLEVAPERESQAAKARSEAERRTDRMAARTWTALGLDEQAEFASLLDGALDHMNID